MAGEASYLCGRGEAAYGVPSVREAEGSEGRADDTGQGLEMSKTREGRRLGKGRVVLPLPTGAPGVNRTGRLDTRIRGRAHTPGDEPSVHSVPAAGCELKPRLPLEERKSPWLGSGESLQSEAHSPGRGVSRAFRR